MKKVFIILLLLIPLISNAQVVFPIDSVSLKPTFTGIVEVKGVRDSLYDKAVEYLAVSLHSLKHSLELQDKSSGKLTGHVTFSTIHGFIEANFFIFFKDNRYKYIITDLNFAGLDGYHDFVIDNGKVSIWKTNLSWDQSQNIKRDAVLDSRNFIDGLYKAETTKNASDF